MASTRATRIGSQLLTMARIEPVEQPGAQPCAIDRVGARRIGGTYARWPWRKAWSWCWKVTKNARVETEPVALAIALQNLVTNALNFSRRAAR